MKEKPAINYEAWARNAITFIRERGLDVDFTNWSGGWKCPIASKQEGLVAGAEQDKSRIGICTPISPTKVEDGK